MNKVSKLTKYLQSIGIFNPRLIKLATELEGKFVTGINYRAVSLALGFGTNPNKEQHPLIMDSMNNDVHTFFNKQQVNEIKAYDFSFYNMNNFNVKNSLSKEERAFLAIVDVLKLLNPRSMIRDYIVASDLKFNQLFKRMRDVGWTSNDWLDINFYKSGVDALNKLQEEYHNDDNEFKNQGSETDKFVDLTNVVYEKDGYRIIYIRETGKNVPLYNNIPETSNDRVVLGNKLHICLGAKRRLYQDNNDGEIYGIFEAGSEEPLAALRIDGDRLEEARCKYNKDLSEELYSVVINYLYDKLDVVEIGDYSGFKLDIDLIYNLKNSNDKEKASILLKNKLDDNSIIVLDKMIDIGIDESKDKQIIIETDKGIEYYKNLKLHRKDGPAREYTDGTKEWWINGQRHRIDGPAIERADGRKEWYLNGQLHRIDGPAVEGANGSKEWWVNDKRHRLDGPAVEYAEGDKEWFINGQKYTEEQFNEIIFNYHNDIDKDKPTEIDLFGNKYWKNKKGEYHRENGPAIKHINGTKSWYLNGKLHREDGPAVERTNRSKEWYFNDKRHRIDGPAIEYAEGDKVWYLNGELHREDGPAIEYISGTKEWWINGKLHRLDGPAVENANGSKSWYLNGQRHRIDGPAFEDTNGNKLWYLNGKQYTKKQFDKIIKEKYSNKGKV